VELLRHRSVSPAFGGEGIATDVDDEVGVAGDVPYRAAAEFGLASVVVGAVVFLAAPMVAILAAQLWAHGDRSPPVLVLHAWLARVAVGVPVFLVLGGLWLGAAGLRRAAKSRGAAALPVAGLLLNGAALVGWTLASIGLLNTTESMLLLSR
jgi:hypothetical protein